jgi:3-keto-5-aminohexanoate cleavage enzyme
VKQLSASFPLSFCPTGMVPQKSDTSHIPITPEEIAEQVNLVSQVGITSVHLHARSDDGSPEYKKARFERTIELIKKTNPDLVICVTTSGRSVAEFEKRADVLDLANDLKPEMASLTPSSLNFAKSASLNAPDTVVKLAERMYERGIKPEFEIFDTGMINYAKYLIAKGIAKPPYVFNILLGGIATAQAGLLELGLMVERLPQDSVWLGAGIGSDQLPANVMSLASGGGVRVGLEDNIYFDSGKQILATNLELVERIVNISSSMGKSVMTPSMFREQYLS